MFLRNFKVIRPSFEKSQEKSLEWLINSQIKAQMQLNQWNLEDEKCVAFANELKEKFQKIGLGENKIHNRGSQLSDFNHANWKEMTIFNLDATPEGLNLTERMAFFDQAASQVFEQMYPIEQKLPPHLIHVTCTGYVAPSPAQKLVSLREMGQGTTVTHAYHMGCYGALPAIRIAMGNYSLEEKETDIVHTEFCTLHMNPTFHSVEQLVVQSLFADGFIKYTLGEKDSASPSLKIVGVLEEVIDDSLSKMSWACHHWGFRMSLSKEIPVLIRKNIEGYLARLGKKGKQTDLKKARYAIHPGGPKIIDQIAEKLELEPEQIRHSKEILKEYGNMSSATLPHVWDRMLRDDSVKKGELIVSMAFGPGLTISGALFEKR